MSGSADAPPHPPATDAAPPVPAPNYGELLLLFICSRVLIYVTAGLGLLGIRKPPGFLPPRTVLDWFLRWDALWYLDVLEHGYHFTGPGDPKTNVGYLPLYPWLARAASLGGLIDTRLAGLIVSLVGFGLACVLLWQLVAREWRDARLATLTVTFLLFSPVSFYFTTLYSESWFLPLTIGCFLAARSDRWWLAGVLGAFAAFTRVVGVALVVPLAWEALGAWRTRAGRARWQPLLAAALPVAGLAAYAVVMWVVFGNPFMYSQAQADSGRHFTWFWGLLARPSFTGLAPFYQVWFGATLVVAFGTLLVGVLLRLPVSFSLYVLTFGFIYISARFVESLPRYFGVLFPLYIVPAMLARRRPQWTAPLLAFSVALQALSVILFVNGYWFA